MEKKDLDYKKIGMALEADMEYQDLEQQRQEKLDRFRAVLGTLTQEQRDAIIDYIGICEEQHWRMVEILCGE